MSFAPPKGVMMNDRAVPGSLLVRTWSCSIVLLAGPSFFMRLKKPRGGISRKESNSSRWSVAEKLFKFDLLTWLLDGVGAGNSPVLPLWFSHVSYVCGPQGLCSPNCRVACNLRKNVIFIFGRSCWCWLMSRQLKWQEPQIIPRAKTL